jgi:hypothetical protein
MIIDTVVPPGHYCIVNNLYSFGRVLTADKPFMVAKRMPVMIANVDGG